VFESDYGADVPILWLLRSNGKCRRSRGEPLPPNVNRLDGTVSETEVEEPRATLVSPPTNLPAPKPLNEFYFSHRKSLDSMEEVEWSNLVQKEAEAPPVPPFSTPKFFAEPLAMTPLGQTEDPKNVRCKREGAGTLPPRDEKVAKALEFMDADMEQLLVLLESGFLRTLGEHGEADLAFIGCDSLTRQLPPNITQTGGRRKSECCITSLVNIWQSQKGNWWTPLEGSKS
jgi:hypothetical protein